VIAYLKGTVLERDSASSSLGLELVVVVRDALGGVGVGYRVATVGVDVEETDSVALWIHSVTNDAGTRLFGFATRDSRDLFVELLGVEGVGPSTARAIMTLGGVDQVRKAIAAGDVAALTCAKGVGKKTAERIVEELASA